MIKTLKIMVDFLLTLFLLLLMPYGLLGEAIHEWLGIAMFVTFIIHHFLNRNWIKNMMKGKYSIYRTLQTILVFSILVCMLGSMISGIILSRHVFDFINISGRMELARKTHMISAYWGFVLMSLHLGLHWKMILSVVGRHFKKAPGICKWAARIVALGIAGYGAYAFFKRSIGSYMFLKVHFVFFAFDESLILFILDYLAVMGLFIFISYSAITIGDNLFKYHNRRR